ncbi:hypothetical protein BDR07DRAFT_1379442 [Suillus spraguei]|nr:hypothetical protein BDR07DRAFT_1379442 [Suillus spraguei]
MYTTDLEVQQTWLLFCMYAILAGNSILIYDHIVTLPEEITLIWRRPKALSAILFLLNRYVALLSNISALVKDFVPVSDEVLQFRYASYFCRAMIVCIIMVIRTYALYGCSKRLLAWMAIVMTALVGLACVGTFGQFSGDVEIVQEDGCNEAVSKMVYVVFIPVLCACSKVFAEQLESGWHGWRLYRTCKINSLPRLSLVTGKNIINVIFCDGAMFFGVMTLFNIPNILTYYFDYFLMIGKVNIRGSLATFTSCMSATLVSRLMLNLHQAINTGIFSTPAQDDGPSLPILTSRVDIEFTVSSHHW